MSRLGGGLAWILIVLGLASGVWAFLDAFGPNGGIAGGPLFVFRYILSAMTGVLSLVVPGITLLLVIKMYEHGFRST